MPHCARERMGNAVSMVSFFGSDAESVEKRDALGVHYLGLSLALAWFYCLWFSPSVFVCMPLMGRAMVYSWLASLGVFGACIPRNAVGASTHQYI